MRPSRSFASPTWVDQVRPREEFVEQIRAALEVGRRINSRQIVVLATADPDIPHDVQVEALVEHLRTLQNWRRPLVSCWNWRVSFPLYRRRRFAATQ